VAATLIAPQPQGGVHGDCHFSSSQVAKKLKNDPFAAKIEVPARSQVTFIAIRARSAWVFALAPCKGSTPPNHYDRKVFAMSTQGA